MANIIDDVAGFGKAFGVLIVVCCVMLPLCAILCAVRLNDDGWKRRLDAVGIRDIATHYVEVDGVRSNWCEIVWKEGAK